MLGLNRLPLLILTAALLASCTAGAEVTAEPPAGEADLVLRMVELPGLLPPGGGLTVPAVSIFGSGVAVVATSRGLVERKLTRAAVRKVSQAAADAGLSAELDPGLAAGPDAGSLTFVFVSGGKRQVNLVVSPQVKVRALADNLKDLDAFLGAEIAAEQAPYKHVKLAVWAQRHETSAEVRPWQFADLATAGEIYETGRCQVVTGDTVEALRTAKTGNSWRSAGADYYVILRPMLPDEEKCPRVESLAVS